MYAQIWESSLEKKSYVQFPEEDRRMPNKEKQHIPISVHILTNNYTHFIEGESKGPGNNETRPRPHVS